MSFKSGCPNNSRKTLIPATILLSHSLNSHLLYGTESNNALLFFLRSQRELDSFHLQSDESSNCPCTSAQPLLSSRSKSALQGKVYLNFFKLCMWSSVTLHMQFCSTDHINVDEMTTNVVLRNRISICGSLRKKK